MTGPDDEIPTVAEQHLLDQLGNVLGPDAAPEGMHTRLEGLLAFRDVDRQLLQLLEEAAAEHVGMRGAATDLGARLEFQLGDGAVALEVLPERHQLSGQLLAGDATEVALERATGETTSAPVDSLGRFTFQRPAPGPARLRLGASPRPPTTDWFLI